MTFGLASVCSLTVSSVFPVDIRSEEIGGVYQLHGVPCGHCCRSMGQHHILQDETKLHSRTGNAVSWPILTNVQTPLPVLIA